MATTFKKIPFFLLSSFALLERTTAPRALVVVRENETAVLVVRANDGHRDFGGSLLFFAIDIWNSIRPWQCTNGVLFCVLQTKILLEIFFRQQHKNTKKEVSKKKKKIKNQKTPDRCPTRQKKTKALQLTHQQKNIVHIFLWTNGHARSTKMEATEKRGKVRVLICGNAGSGKTTLLRHVRDDVDVSTSSTTPSTSTTTTTSTATKTMRQHQHKSLRSSGKRGTHDWMLDGGKLIFHEHVRTEHFVELWDVGGHDQFKDDRAAFLGT